MRYDKRYSRTLTIITTPEIPRQASGGIALCHLCQRAAYFAGGFLALLTEDLRRETFYKREIVL